MVVNYELRITTGGLIANPLSDIIASVAGAISLYPGYSFQSAQVEQTPSGDIIYIYYSDDNAEPQAEVIPLIVYAILVAITVLGIAYVAYEIFVVAPQSPLGQITIIAGAVAAVALLITAIKGKGD